MSWHFYRVSGRACVAFVCVWLGLACPAALGEPITSAQRIHLAQAPTSSETSSEQSAAPIVQTQDEQPSSEIPQVVGESTLPRDLSPWGMFMAADHVVKAVMISLALASVLSWTVWLAKTLELLGARRNARAAISALSRSKTLEECSQTLRNYSGPIAAFARAAAIELSMSSDALQRDGVKERVASRIERIESAASRRMNRGTGILATIGSTGPFVGLFGTVWGIMNSFIGISKAQTTNLAIVAPGIAEALLATALGLVAAIPAVMIFNAFSRAIGGYRSLLADGAAEIMRLVSRDLDRAIPLRGSRPPREWNAAE